MEKETSITVPEIEARIGDWKILKEPQGRSARTYAPAICPQCEQVVRVQISYCTKYSICTPCRRQTAERWLEISLELQTRIISLYKEHERVCLQYKIAPEPFDVFAREILDTPNLATEEAHRSVEVSRPSVLAAAISHGELK